jgi:mono/diheme cytochrome c family protein
MGKMRKAIHGQRKMVATLGGLALLLLVVVVTTMAVPSEVKAGWPWNRTHKLAACGHKGCAPDHCLYAADWAGEWYWMRSPDQERRVVMSLYNRYCLRCHGIDGRGVWDIPDVPDFTNTTWQATRPDSYRTRVILEGRGAVMPSFRGTLTLEESAAMACFLHTFVPGTEVSRPDLGEAGTGNKPAASNPTAGKRAALPPLPPSPATPPTTPSPFTR